MIESKSIWWCALLGVSLLIATSCSLNTSSQTRVIYVTPTPGSDLAYSTTPSFQPVPTDDTALQSRPTADRVRIELYVDGPREHVVQPGDTLSGIAATYNTTIAVLISLNELNDADRLFVGQRIQLPEALPESIGPANKLLPDSRLVRGPGSETFDIERFILMQTGYIRFATDEVVTRLEDGSERRDLLNSAAVVSRVALEFSVDPRVLLALLEYRAAYLSSMELSEDQRLYPLIDAAQSGPIDRSGLYRQLAWAANTLNGGYYGWKLRGVIALDFDDPVERILYDPSLNAGTVALQYLLSRYQSRTSWSLDVSTEGFFATYVRLFGDPFADSVEPLVPPDLQQAVMQLPFASSETWFFTGGAHGGWGNGSAWAAVDFAPPDDPQGVACYTSDYWVRAVADGVIARSGDGVVVLDLDGDGLESTGWTVLYLHLAEDGRVAEDQAVVAGDPLGRAACTGGFSTATHLHIARRYNGEWIPAHCLACGNYHPRPVFDLGGWQVVSLAGQEYQGFLVNGPQRRTAQQGRASLDNRLSW